MRISDWSSDVCSSDLAKEGAGPVTLSADLGYLKLVLTHAAAVHGVDVKVEPVDLARVALKRLGLISKSRQRDRRPTPDEIRRLLDHFDHNRYLVIPMGRIVRFALASAMRQEEISRIRWSDVDRSEEQTSELQSLMPISYAVFC